MKQTESLKSQALQTYERITLRLELALTQQRKMSPRASRTTAYAAFQGRITRLRTIQTNAYNRYKRRMESE